MGRSQIRNEIIALLQDYNCDELTGTISAKFAFPAGFTGFAGHFPGEPILPGICQIQCLLVLLSRQLGKDVNLVSVKRAKFLNTVIPEDQIFVKGDAAVNENSVIGTFVITKNCESREITVSRLKIEGEFITL